MDNKLVVISIAAVIGIIVLGSVLMPILDDATATTDKFENDGWIHMKKYDESAEITAFWDHTKPHQITVNGEDIDMPYSPGGSDFVLTAGGTSTFLLRYSSTSPTTGALSFFDSTGGYHATTAASTDLSISISGGTLTADNGSGSTVSGTYTDYLFFISDDSGEYVMKKATETAYLNSDSEIYGIGRTALGNSNYSMLVTGNIEDGFTATAISGVTPPTISDVTGAYVNVNDHIDLYSFDKVTFVATLNGTDYNVTYNQVIVPYEVTAERAVHFTNGQNAIFAAIPVMIILAVLLGVVALVIRSRMD